MIEKKSRLICRKHTTVFKDYEQNPLSLLSFGAKVRGDGSVDFIPLGDKGEGGEGISGAPCECRENSRTGGGASGKEKEEY